MSSRASYKDNTKSNSWQKRLSKKNNHYVTGVFAHFCFLREKEKCTGALVNAEVCLKCSPNVSCCIMPKSFSKLVLSVLSTQHLLLLLANLEPSFKVQFQGVHLKEASLGPGYTDPWHKHCSILVLLVPLLDFSPWAETKWNFVFAVNFW